MAAFEAFNSSVEVSTVKTSAVEMRVAQVGEGPDIVWIPGGDSPAKAWQIQMLYFDDLLADDLALPRAGETDPVCR